MPWFSQTRCRCRMGWRGWIRRHRHHGAGAPSGADSAAGSGGATGSRTPQSRRCRREAAAPPPLRRFRWE